MLTRCKKRNSFRFTLSLLQQLTWTAKHRFLGQSETLISNFQVQLNQHKYILTDNAIHGIMYYAALCRKSYNPAKTDFYWLILFRFKYVQILKFHNLKVWIPGWIFLGLSWPINSKFKNSRSFVKFPGDMWTRIGRRRAFQKQVGFYWHTR